MLQGGPTRLVLGSCDHVKSDSFVPAQAAHSTIQSDSSQEYVKLNSRSRASLRQWQHRLRLLKEVQDFLMYQFQDRKLQPNIIDGYRSVIADKLDKSPINVCKMRISLVSWTVPIETDLRVGGASPPGTSHWCCINWQGSIRTP